MFENLGAIKTKNTTKKVVLYTKDLKNGLNSFDDIIILKNGKNYKVYDRICNHAGGKLINKDNRIICPIHMWEFKPEEGVYKNGIKKKQIKFKVSNDKLIIYLVRQITQIKKKINLNNHHLKIRYFNHAFLIVEGPNFKFATDPWAIGPAFANGWWLKDNTKVDWLKELNECNFIYISHNHPDHLNYSTLKLCNKKIPIITPNFLNNSTSKLLEDYGFKKIYKFNFNENINLKGTKLIFTFLKSGDFRDDSGIYFSHGKFTCLADVDSNSINFDKLPLVDLYCSSYAGGATAYPIMFDNYSNKDKIWKQKVDSIFLLKKKIENIKNTKSKYFLPYAGSFENKLKRDIFVRDNLYKNKISDYEIRLKNSKTLLLNINKYDSFVFKSSKLVKKLQIKKNKSLDFDKDKFLIDFKKENIINKKYIMTYFNKSGFSDSLILKIDLVNDNFKKKFLTFFVDFRESSKVKVKFNDIYLGNTQVYGENLKFLNLKIRSESFMHVIYNKLPWEDLLIGFQCKVLRIPNIYNVKFWNHFTNIYISNRQIRETNNCSKCKVLNNHLNNLILNTKKVDKVLNEINKIKNI